MEHLQSVLSVSFGYFNEIRDQLISKGFEERKIISLEKFFPKQIEPYCNLEFSKNLRNYALRWFIKRQLLTLEVPCQ